MPFIHSALKNKNFALLILCCVGRERAQIPGDEGLHVSVDKQHEARPQYPAPLVLGMLAATASAGMLEEHRDGGVKLCEEGEDVHGASVLELESSERELCLAGVRGLVVVNCLRHAVEEVGEAVRVLRDRADDAV
jgi:hypothetical protein